MSGRGWSATTNAGWRVLRERVEEVVHGLRATSPGRWMTRLRNSWALGWTVTTLPGIDVGAQYTVFGATGAVTFSALSGLLLLRLLVPAPESALDEVRS